MNEGYLKMAPSVFEIVSQDAQTQARCGILNLSHGVVETPCYMPVGTQASVKALSPEDVRLSGGEIILANTYHLFLRPGISVIKKSGGLHKFMHWNHPILTDSGGFQVFSLSKFRKITDEGVEFKSPLNGQLIFLTPENVISYQQQLNSDIMMMFDECIPYPSEKKYVEESVDRTNKWAKRCWDAYLENETDQLLFGIVQGSEFFDLREKSAQELLKIGFQGYAIGGVSVGETKEKIYEVVQRTINFLPNHQPRYLMGVGTPEDLWECVQFGIDMFDCVMPTRVARNGTALTRNGRMLLKNACFKEDFLPLDEDCSCECCRNYSRAYLHHLFMAEELLVLRLISLHNLHFMIEVIGQIRDSIKKNRFLEEKKNFLARYFLR